MFDYNEKETDRFMEGINETYFENGCKFECACFAVDDILNYDLDVSHTPDEIIRKVAEAIEPMIGEYDGEIEVDLDKLRAAIYAEFAEVQADYWKAMIKKTAGKFFRVTFIKKNGEVRTMQARTGVKKGVKGTGHELKPDTQVARVYDVKKKAFRTIPCNRIISMAAQRWNYSNVTRAIA